ncbi:MAG TPA: hypothetical protein PKA83_06940 [Pirellulaceae bacterium]|nr:hypothetical protein [Pirellulaceae bacterium]
MAIALLVSASADSGLSRAQAQDSQDREAADPNDSDTRPAKKDEAADRAGAKDRPDLARNDIRYQRPVLIELKGVIDWNNSTYFHTRVHRARRMGADLLIVQIDSPGGLVEESLRIANTLRDIDWAHTIAFVPHQAISGGALIALGCDEIILANKASIGDIGAIEFDPGLFAFRYVPAKVQSDLVAKSRILAESKGHAPEIAEAMIDKDVLLFANMSGPEKNFVTVRLQPGLTPQQVAEQAGINLNEWTLVPESGAERFLTFVGNRASEVGLASSNAESLRDVLQQVRANPSQTVHFQYNFADRLVYVLNHPLITILLVIVGIVALYIEFSAPGIGGGGLIAILCAAIYFWSRYMVGTAGALEVILFVCGLTFLFMEIFVIPGWGVSGITGLALVVLSAVMASLNFIVPESQAEWNKLISTVLILLCSGVGAMICMTWITKKIGSIPILNRFVLAPQLEGVASSNVKDVPGGAKAKPPANPLVSVGDWGVSETVLRPAGRARFGNKSIDVVSDGSFIEPGRQIRVTESRGNVIVVTEIEEN